MTDAVAAIVSRCLAGEQAAMLELVERFQAQVFGLCYRMLGHRHDAEDMAQESFARALRSLASWDAQRPFEPWLLTIAGNRCRSLIATRGRRPQLSSSIDTLPDPAPAQDGQRILAEEVGLALDFIRDDYRRAFLLFHEQELSYAEIGELLGCPLGTVKTWVHRARRELVTHLRARGAIEGIDPCNAKNLKHA